MSIALAIALVGVIAAGVAALIAVAGWWAKTTSRKADHIHTDRLVVELHEKVVPHLDRPGESVVEEILALALKMRAVEERVNAVNLRLEQHIADEDVTLEALTAQLGALDTQVKALFARLEEHLTFEEIALTEIRDSTHLLKGDS